MEDNNTDDFNITTAHKAILQQLVEKLKDITLRIEELDTREDRILGESEGSQDERRAINISRTIHVNEQKEIENKISEIISRTKTANNIPRNAIDINEKNIDHSGNNDPPIAPTPSPPSTPQYQQPQDQTKSDDGLLEPLREIEEAVLSFIPSVEIKATISDPKPASKRKPPSFKFHVRSFKICYKCNARLPANFRICGRCGSKLQNICPHCASEVPSGVAFCGKCGRKIL